MSSIHERIIEIRKNARLTQKGLADQLGVSQAYVSSIEKGKRQVSRNVFDQIVELFNVDAGWLHSGGSGQWSNTTQPGQMMQVEEVSTGYARGQNERILPITVDADNNPNIVMVPVKAQAGYAQQRVEPTFMAELPSFNLPDSRFRTGTFRAFEVDGDSMEPTLYGGDTVVCKYIQDWRWLRELELFVVVMQEDVFIKRLRNHINTRGTLELISDNTFYPPMEVPVEQIMEVWQVAARITLHLPAPRA